MSSPSSAPLRDRIVQELLEARRRRDTVGARALRTTLAAVENAEAVEVDLGAATPSESVAGAVVGLGAAEATRRSLDDAEVLAVVESEIQERTEAAAVYEGAGRTAEADLLRAEAAVLEGLRR